MPRIKTTIRIVASLGIGMKITSTRFVILACELLIALSGAYISAFKLDGQPALVAAFFTVIYSVITLKLELHFAAEDKLFGKFPVLHSLQQTDIDAERIDIIEKFHSINEPLLREIATSAWRDLASEIRSLYDSHRSENLTPAQYIEYIERELRNVRPGIRIFAISLFGDDEFLPNGYERNFHDAQLRAITENGATIERIFVCSEARMAELMTTPYWNDHLGTIDGRFAPREEVEASGIKIRNGFIQIGSVLFDDKPQPRGLSGIVSTNGLDIDRAKRDFFSLERHARPLADVFSESTY